MIEARDKGCGVLLISADFDEILEVSDRIVVMFEGQIMGVFSGKNPPIEEISWPWPGNKEGRMHEKQRKTRQFPGTIISILLAFVIGCIIMAVLGAIPLWRWSPFGSVPSAACGT